MFAIIVLVFKQLYKDIKWHYNNYNNYNKSPISLYPKRIEEVFSGQIS
ncbi:hypothetical protein MHH56_24125 [Paenibacillus sp. FSL K6-3182]